MEIEQNSNSLKSSNRNKSQYRLEVEEPEEPDEFDENEREEGLCRGGTSRQVFEKKFFDSEDIFEKVFEKSFLLLH